MKGALFSSVALLAICGSALGAQIPRREPPKSPTTARIIGIIPGAGHMYAGEVGHGFAYMGGTAGLVFLSAAAALGGCLDDGPGGTCGPTVAANVFAVGALGLWGWSIYDAGRAVKRVEARKLRRMSLIITPMQLQRENSAHRALRLGVLSTF